ncbi:MAG: DNA-directed DNA polymerase II small subunit [Candidatus Woesearchaeota archaeon]
MILEQKKRIVKFLIQNNVLVDNTILQKIEEKEISEKLEELIKRNVFLREEEILKLLGLDYDKKENLSTDKEKILQDNQNNKDKKYSLKIIQSHKELLKKKTVQDFISYFNTRYKKLSAILQKKQELADATSIKRINSKTEKEEVALIGLVYEIAKTKNGNIILTLEDPTGQIKAIVHNTKQDLINIAEDIVPDECLGILGVFNKGIIYVNKIIFPEIPPTKELKKSPEECYAIFTGDTHIGSKQFLKDNFLNMISWLNKETGSEHQKKIAEKVKYLFIVGDLVDGLGIYPTQYNDLEIKDIKNQYKELAEYLSKIPPQIAVILCPGNHDSLRLSEPQPPLPKDFAEELYNLPNVFIVSSPALVNIESQENFSGFDILLYHGTSLNYYAENVKSISSAGGHTRADLIMKFLLQRRHLAPTHTSTQYMPDSEDDPLVVEKVPDFFVTGHIHRATISSYRNVTLLNCSCWIEMTEYQEKVGLVPEPSRVILVNLQTREAKMMRF